jgi:hypothetical protein
MPRRYGLRREAPALLNPFHWQWRHCKQLLDLDRLLATRDLA